MLILGYINLLSSWYSGTTIVHELLTIMIFERKFLSACISDYMEVNESESTQHESTISHIHVLMK